MRLVDIAGVLGRSVSLTCRRAKRLGLPTKNPRWTETEDGFLRIFYRVKPTAWRAALQHTDADQEIAV